MFLFCVNGNDCACGVYIRCLPEESPFPWSRPCTVCTRTPCRYTAQAIRRHVHHASTRSNRIRGTTAHRLFSLYPLRRLQHVGHSRTLKLSDAFMCRVMNVSLKCRLHVRFLALIRQERCVFVDFVFGIVHDEFWHAVKRWPNDLRRLSVHIA